MAAVVGLVGCPDRRQDEQALAECLTRGTATYSHGRELSVVDTDLRVHAVEGLCFADASVMPLIVSANTNPAAFMIAERAVDLLRGASIPARRLEGQQSVLA